MTTYYVRTDGNNANTGTANTSGGAWADPGYAMATISGADHIVYLQSGTYTLTTTTPGAGGPVVFPSSAACALIGFETTPGDGCPNGNRPIIDAGSQTSISIIDTNSTDGENQAVLNIEVNGQLGASNTGFSCAGSSHTVVINCRAIDCTLYGFDNGEIIGCSAISSGTTGVGFRNGRQRRCFCDGMANGFDGPSIHSSHCISANANSGGFGSANGYRNTFVGCVAYNSGGYGFQFRNSAPLSGAGVIDCVAVNNTTYGFQLQTVGGLFLKNCASYNNGTARTDGNELFDEGAITLTADPFIDAANGDFRLNTDSGGGALLANAGIGIPGQVNTIDIGAVPLDQLVTRFVPRLRG